MDLFDQLKNALGIKPAPVTPTNALRQILDSARRAKVAEDYPLALELLGRARQLATENREINALSLIALHEVDILIQQRRYDEAQTMLDGLRARIGTPPPIQHRAQLAYVLSAQGALAQARGDWTTARERFEAALKLARDAKAAGAEGRAMGHLAHTYLQEGNASYATHLLREALPKLNVSGDIELSSYFVGLLGEAQIASGHHTEGEHMFTRALRLADHMQYRMYQRRWRLALAEQLARAGRFDVALNTYQQAFDLFQGRPPDASYMLALARASDVCLSLGEPEKALDFAQRAADLTDQIDDPAAIAYTEYTLGIALRANRRTEDALAHLQAASTAYAVLDTREAQEMRIAVLRMLAAAQTSSGLPDEQVIDTYRQSIALAQKVGARIELGHAYRDLGLFYSGRGQHQQAITEWQQALAIYTDEKALSQLARLHCDLGKTRKALGQGARALKDFEEALTMLSSLDLETRGVVLSNVASAYADNGDVESADDFFTEAIGIAHKLGDTAAEALRRGNHGWFLVVTGRARRATSALEQAVHVSRAAGLPLAAAVQTDNLGMAQFDLGSYEAALHYHTQAQEMLDRLDPRTDGLPRWRAILSGNRARTLMALGRVEEAVPLIDAALEEGRTSSDLEVLTRALQRRGELLVRHRPAPDAAAETISELVAVARRADIRYLVADALALQSEQQALIGMRERSAALWAEAARLYGLLHHPLAKSEPAWLSAPQTT